MHHHYRQSYYIILELVYAVYAFGDEEMGAGFAVLAAPRTRALSVFADMLAWMIRVHILSVDKIW